MEMEWEIPVLKDLNMATFAASCDSTGASFDAIGMCATNGSAAGTAGCVEGSGGTPQ